MNKERRKLIAAGQAFGEQARTILDDIKTKWEAHSEAGNVPEEIPDDIKPLLVSLGEKLTEANGPISEAAAEEQDYYDNMPESLQNGDKGSTAQEQAESLLTIADDLDEMATDCGTVKVEDLTDLLAEVEEKLDSLEGYDPG